MESWLIANGHTTQTFNFNGTISDYRVDGEKVGEGNIELRAWGDINQVYNFNGNMSGFSGDILAPNGSLALTFGRGATRDEAARQSISGTGNINIWGSSFNDALTYNVAGVTSTITNGSIATQTINFNGDADTVYNVSSAITAGVLSSNGATVNMLNGSSLSVCQSAVNATDLNLALTSSSLSVLNGSSIGSLTLEGDVFLSLSLSTAQAALTTTSLTIDPAAFITIQASIAGGVEAGQSYTLLDNADALTDLSQFTVDFGAGASTTGLSIDANGNLIYTAARASAALTWTGGNGTWQTDGAGWTGEASEFATFDSVTFSNANTGATDEITIVGNVVPSAITVSGDGDTSFSGNGAIIGAATLTKDGQGTLTIANSGNSFTGVVTVNGGTLAITSSNDLSGGVTVNSGGTLLIDADNALGTGSATIASGATIAFKELDHYSSTSVTRANGSTLKFIYDDANPESNTNADIQLGTGSLSGGRILAASGGGTIRIGGEINATSVSDRYVRGDEGYTVDVATGTTLVDNVRLRLTGETTTITGGGVYEIHSAELSAEGNSKTILNIEQDTTLKVTSSVNNENGGQGGFMLSNYPNEENEVNVAGTLDLACGISDRDGEGVLAVASTGTLIMRQGLTTHTGKETKNIDINGGALVLYSQADGTNHAGNGLDVDIMNGSTIYAASATTRVSTALGFSNAAGDTYTFASAPTADDSATANTISLRQTVTANNATVKIDSGTLEFGGADNTIGTAVLAAGTTLKTDTAAGSNMTITSATLAEGATISSNNMSVGGIAITGKGGSDATIVAQSEGGSIADSSFNNVSLSNATVTGTLAVRSVDTITSEGASYDNVTFTNVNLLAKDELTTLTSVTLNNVNLQTQNSGHFNLEGNVTISNSVLDTNVFSAGSSSNITYENTSLTGGIVTTKTNDLTFTTLQGTQATDVQAWTVDGVQTFLDGASGTLTLILGELEGFTTLGTGEGEQQFAAFILDGVADLGTLEYNNITQEYSVDGTIYNQEALGYTSVDGNIVLYIPEPSTATLSLLALVALAARRRRKST